MTDFAWVCVVLFITVFNCFAVNYAYSLGVCDGYGFAKEPLNPGYDRAKGIVRALRHRFPGAGDE